MRETLHETPGVFLQEHVLQQMFLFIVLRVWTDEWFTIQILMRSLRVLIRIAGSVITCSKHSWFTFLGRSSICCLEKTYYAVLWHFWKVCISELLRGQPKGEGIIGFSRTLCIVRWRRPRATGFFSLTLSRPFLTVVHHHGSPPCWTVVEH